MMLCKKLWSDRFSNLPDDVTHHILSFLGVRDLASVGAVSKRCREFYLSVPSVNIDASCYLPVPLVNLDASCYLKTSSKLGALMCFWDRYMFQRGVNKIQRFYINWTFFTRGIANKDSVEQYRINSWIHNAVRCNVEELNLNFTACGGFTFVLPSCLYQSQSFKSLVLKCLGKMTLEAPPVSLSCNLRYLQLTSVRIADEKFCKWISSTCKCIKELQLIQVKGIKNITIQSSSLESFTFVGMDLVDLNISGQKLRSIEIKWNFYSSPGYCSLNISAPNLEDLTWAGKVLNSQNLGKLLNLKRAFIALEPTVDDNLSEVFSSICRTKDLGINENTMKAMFKDCFMQAPLDDIRRLALIQLPSFSNDIVPITASLLRRTGYLNSLVLMSSKPSRSDSKSISSSGFDMGYWKLQNLTFIYQLKDVSIDLSSGSNEIEFAKYILENAPNLKKIVIRHHPGSQQSNIVVGKVTRCKIISRAIIVIQEIR
ncbi:F-box/LRR-repeat protein [Rosa sericea]